LRRRRRNWKSRRRRRRRRRKGDILKMLHIIQLLYFIGCIK